MLIRSVFLVRATAAECCDLLEAGGDQWARYKAEWMAGSRAQPPVGAGSSAKTGAVRREAAEYIGSMLDGLRLVAHQARLPFLFGEEGGLVLWNASASCF